jgi:predicted GNAT superfamily acetyltransferase
VQRDGVTVREVSTVEELTACDRLFATVWDGELAAPVNLMRALSHSGHYLAGAFESGRLVGASLGFVWGRGERLHSHITGVVPDLQGRGVGYGLKLHQRGWAAERGLRDITWTFDPLVRRNAWFNLVKLGARIESYHPDFYGPMADGVNDGDETDRCFVVWEVHTPEPLPPPPEHGPAIVLLREGPNGEPDRVDADRDGVEVFLCQVPADIVALRRSDPTLGRRWRLDLRQTMGEAMQDGYVAVTMTKEGHYVLTRAGA